MWEIKEHFYKLQEVLFPARCFGCKKTGEIFCNLCLQKCSKNVDFLGPHILSIYSFKDPLIKKIVHALKYYRRKDLAIPISEELAKEIENVFIKNNTEYRNSCILVPIPMHKIRKYIRGYNQAEILAENISKLLQIPTRTDLLQRVKFTKRQVEANNRTSRISNQKNTFVVVESVKDMNIIIVDDVITTGATIDEARKILFKNGAKDVRAVTIAH